MSAQTSTREALTALAQDVLALANAVSTSVPATTAGEAELATVRDRLSGARKRLIAARDLLGATVPAPVAAPVATKTAPAPAPILAPVADPSLLTLLTRLVGADLAADLAPRLSVQPTPAPEAPAPAPETVAVKPAPAKAPKASKPASEAPLAEVVGRMGNGGFRARAGRVYGIAKRLADGGLIDAPTATAIGKLAYKDVDAAEAQVRDLYQIATDAQIVPVAPAPVAAPAPTTGEEVAPEFANL